MSDYFVAKTPNGKLVGKFTIEEIRASESFNRIEPQDSVTPALGNYEEVVKNTEANWTTVATLLGGQIQETESNSESSDDNEPSKPLGEGNIILMIFLLLLGVFLLMLGMCFVAVIHG
jgi:hypothetical protein